MMYKSYLAMAAAMLSVSTVNGHMELLTPHPYGPDTLDNSPLYEDGGDFPCKQRAGVYAPPESENIMAVGEKQTLSFLGSAVHGGGSCQVSLTEDLEPTVDSTWKVIHSIEGGCPANVEGNLPENAYGRDASTFDYKIPDSIAPGKYTLAWTWFNRVGNREMYMNCAPITVTGPSKKRYAPTPKEQHVNAPMSKRQDLPDMFVANINGCMTEEGVDIRFPSPGNSVVREGKTKYLQTDGQSTCVDPSSPNGNSPEPPSSPPGLDGNGGSNSPPSANNPKPDPKPETPAQPVDDAPEPEPETPKPEPETPEPEPETPEPEPETPSEPTVPDTSGDGSALSGSCSVEGEWNCVGGSSFQRCASGTWSAAQPLADGTSCEAGQGVELKMVDSKRSVHGRDLHSRRRSIGSRHA